MPTPRTGVRLQDALLDSVEALAIDAAKTATLSYSRAIPALTPDMHDKINKLADDSAATADAYFRMCGVPPTLVGRNPMEELASRAREMARASLITRELVDSTLAVSPMHNWLWEQMQAATEIFRNVDLMARMLATIPLAADAPIMATEPLPDPPSVEDVTDALAVSIGNAILDAMADVPDDENVGQGRPPQPMPISNEVFESDTSEMAELPPEQITDEAYAAHMETLSIPAEPVEEGEYVIEPDALSDQEVAMLEVLNHTAESPYVIEPSDTVRLV